MVVVPKIKRDDDRPTWRDRVIKRNQEEQNNNKGGENMGVYCDDLPEPVPIPDVNKKGNQKFKLDGVVAAANELLRKEVEKEQQEEYKLAKDKQYENLMEFVNTLVNGDSISQLFLNHELTDKAKEELIKLQEATATKNISESKRELEALKQSITEAKAVFDELSNTIREEQEKEKKLNEDLKRLDRKKQFLAKLINNDLATIVDTMKETEEQEEIENNIEWKWKPTEWDGIRPYIRNIKIEDFDAYIEGKIREYSEYADCSYEEAKAQFYELSPQIDKVSAYIKEHLSDLKTYNYFGRWFDDWNRNIAVTDDLYNIKVPIYQIVKVKSKKR